MMQFLIAAPRSGSGKTTMTCAVLAALKKRGADPCAFKSGPDYIDPMFHRSALQVDSHNLDLFISDRPTVQALYARCAAGHGAAVCEGAMGFYDGQGLTTRASAWELADTLEAEGIETEIIQAGKTAHPCNACATCKKTNRCIYDDLVNETAPKFAEADALVIGSPVYYASPAGGAISFMDRLFFSTPYINKTMKVGASVVSCRRGGNTATFDTLNKYFTILQMPVVSSQYWNSTLAQARRGSPTS